MLKIWKILNSVFNLMFDNLQEFYEREGIQDLRELSKFIRKAYVSFFLELKFDLYYFYSQYTVKINLDIPCSLILLM